jgi:hypothetical protein
MKGGPFSKLDLNQFLQDSADTTQDIFTQFLGGPSQAENEQAAMFSAASVAKEQARYAAEAAAKVAEANAMANLYGGVQQNAAQNTTTLLWVGAGAAVVILAIILGRK